MLEEDTFSCQKECQRERLWNAYKPWIFALSHFIQTFFFFDSVLLFSACHDQSIWWFNGFAYLHVLALRATRGSALLKVFSIRKREKNEHLEKSFEPLNVHAMAEVCLSLPVRTSSRPRTVFSTPAQVQSLDLPESRIAIERSRGLVKY